MTSKIGVLFLLAMAGVICGGCQAHEASSRLCLGRACYDVEVVQTPEAREKGLMFRDRLDQGKGMLFIFDQSGDYAFWMQNMKFSIDILWISAEKKVVHIEQNVPPCQAEPCAVYDPGVPARFVLEIPAGDAVRYGITQGMQVR